MAKQCVQCGKEAGFFKGLMFQEIRGRESRGGESRIISKGDVVVIPNGTPHWFKEVNGPISYYVVKVRAAL